MSNEKVARIGYNTSEDRYEVLISSDGGNHYDMDSAYKCVHSKKQNEDEEPMFVSVQVIIKMKQLISLGYRITY